VSVAIVTRDRLSAAPLFFFSARARIRDRDGKKTVNKNGAEDGTETRHQTSGGHGVLRERGADEYARTKGARRWRVDTRRNGGG
jgi:hypothetical protein